MPDSKPQPGQPGFTVDDLIANAFNDNPLKVDDAFQSVIATHVQNELAGKREEIAKDMFSGGEGEGDGGI